MHPRHVNQSDATILLTLADASWAEPADTTKNIDACFFTPGTLCTITYKDIITYQSRITVHGEGRIRMPDGTEISGPEEFNTAFPTREMTGQYAWLDNAWFEYTHTVDGITAHREVGKLINYVYADTITWMINRMKIGMVAAF